MGCVHGKCCGADDYCCCCCCCWCCGDSSAAGSEGGGGGAADVAPCGVVLHNDGSLLGQRRQVLLGAPLGSAAVPSHHFRLVYSSLSQRGHYPESPDRENQDCLCIRTRLQDNPNLHFFGVFDGHGQFGAQCAAFVRDRLVDILSADTRLLDSPAEAYASTFLATNTELHDSSIDDTMSGTTAITVLVSGDTLYVANVGDSRAVAGVWNGSAVVAEDLSCDQTPFRKDEYERVKQCGARVLSVDQVEGVKDPNIQHWGNEENDDGDPPRLWVPNGMYPGTAFTRSVGDSTAESIGVIAEPEVKVLKIASHHLFFVIASDGVFEFLSSQAVVDMVSKFEDPRDACSAVVSESYKNWLEHESRTDDITIIVVHIKDLSHVDSTLRHDPSEVMVFFKQAAKLPKLLRG
ncbi:probable protein phosphatase 2C 35 isoform X2 [Ananas comosus]|uniref:protein-serine/threonine phosphatase n=1 Tax=Ananas comosus TaxID=4615 RepID=A0A6P5EXY6_ANACO|nr:probable protein phosphatase 2C 35 isoform X2 [Ananas comosus]